MRKAPLGAFLVFNGIINKNARSIFPKRTTRSRCRLRFANEDARQKCIGGGFVRNFSDCDRYLWRLPYFIRSQPRFFVFTNVEYKSINPILKTRYPFRPKRRNRWLENL